MRGNNLYLYKDFYLLFFALQVSVFNANDSIERTRRREAYECWGDMQAYERRGRGLEAGL
jgi:hypothetical protein